ncbi:hypothetical protein [Devosia nitrariae]|uniref:Bartonella effector protein BID domain-containing protein n=1 Tax=Devosia nitrariae TaxID=2071872 RepID=A0ABQ5W1S1_9HYPH|nr:hypothetical protein [Devosia nitrariae]GLQ53759.1 hypothetical protein GCM10010862_10180 [Devosia nitrariae]
MNQTTAEPGGAVSASTVLDTQTVALESGGGRPGSAEARLRQGEPQLTRPGPQSTDLETMAGKGKEAGKKPVSVRETLDTEKARLDKEAERKARDAAEAAKVKAGEGEAKEAKTEPRGGGKAPVGDEDPGAGKATDRGAPEKPATGQGAPDDRQSHERESTGRKPGSAEGRLRQGEHAEPPARFLPEARTKWANVPNEVKAEVHRLSKEYEGEIDRHRQATERFEGVKRFDDIARANGRELKDTLNRIVAVEQALARSPIAGLEMILREVGPRKADGSPLSLYDVAQSVARQTPQQYAQSLQGALAQRSAARAGGQQRSPEVRAMAQEVRSMRIELAASRLEPMLTAFAAAHPDYHALEERIAGVLTSGVIDKLYGTGLTPEQRLIEAYRMAGGTAPSSRSEPPAPPSHSSADTAPPVHPEAGKKSVRGAPNGGEDAVADRPKQSIRDLLKSEMRSIPGG